MTLKLVESKQTCRFLINKRHDQILQLSRLVMLQKPKIPANFVHACTVNTENYKSLEMTLDKV